MNKMTDYGEEMGMDLGAVESFVDLTVIPRGMDERFNVTPYTMVPIADFKTDGPGGSGTGYSANGEPSAPSGVEEAAPDPMEQSYKEGYEAARAEFAAAQADLANRVDEMLAQLNKALQSAEQDQEEQTIRLAVIETACD